MNERPAAFRAIFGLSCVAVLAAAAAAVASIIFPAVYGDLIEAGTIVERDRAGALAQDIITLPLAALFIGLLVGYRRRATPKRLLLLIGGLGYFFYAYGLYAIEGYYTLLYPLYLLAVGSALWGIIYGLIELLGRSECGLELSTGIRRAVALFMLLILLVLVPAWLARMLAQVRQHATETAYAVILLDLCIEFPAFAIAAVGLLRRRAYAVPLAGVMLVKAFTVCLSWGFGEWYAIAYAGGRELSLAFIATALTAISIVLLVLYLRRAALPPRASAA
jgi:hypothetical protein